MLLQDNDRDSDWIPGLGADWDADWDAMDAATDEITPHLRQRLHRLVSNRADRVQARLAAADGPTPLNPEVRLLGDSLGLNAVEIQVLDYLELHQSSERLRMRACGRAGGRFNHRCLAGCRATAGYRPICWRNACSHADAMPC